MNSLFEAGGGHQACAPDDIDSLIARIRELKVGGTYWAGQPALPDHYRLVRVRDPVDRAQQIAALGSGSPIVEWREPDWAKSRSTEVLQVVGPCDPWHLLANADGYLGDPDDEVAPIALLTAVRSTWLGGADLRDEFRAWFGDVAAAPYRDPFTDDPMDLGAAIELCGVWRRLIDSNRPIKALLGFANWKRETVSPMLWGGAQDPPFVTRANSPGGKVAIWRSKADPEAVGVLATAGAKLIEVEDGFIRSSGLGADCVPPLSIVVDRAGIYFDPGQPSDLEQLLQSSNFSPELLRRARSLRERIVNSGITKYAAGERHFRRLDAGKRYLLAVGQVEDDRAVVSGRGPRTNIELLRRVREGSPQAHILYKPHPDVEAGHRRGAVDENSILAIADEIIRGFPISSLMDAVDEVHVNTSLAGFEALMRGKPVTTYGVPFYAGWGLTDDRGPVPARRTARLDLDELVAATLLLYPRYLDPVTGLPCPPEVLVSRLSEGEGTRTSPIVQFRRLQGRMNRVLTAVRSRL